MHFEGKPPNLMTINISAINTVTNVNSYRFQYEESHSGAQYTAEQLMEKTIVVF